MRRLLWLFGLLGCVLPLGLFAAEGLWPLDQLPRSALKQQYDFEPDQVWVEHLMSATVRLADGCSGAFVSGQGLVISNAHCLLSCVQGLSVWRDYVNRGFVAHKAADELRCPGMELHRLEQMREVTAQMQEALRDKLGADYARARQLAQARLESECVDGQAERTRCDLVELHGGSVYQLYRYRRYQDVRLVFVPEYQAAFFGGDSDNFNFPRYSFDVALLRVYEDGRPLKNADYLPLQAKGAQPGELTFVIGNPGRTDRQLTMAQLYTRRDQSLLQTVIYEAQRHAMLAQYSRSSERAAHYAQADLSLSANRLKVYRGELQALHDAEWMASRQAEESRLRAAAGDQRPWNEIAQAEQWRGRLDPSYQMLEQGRAFFSNHFRIARDLVRGVAERERPDAQRLPEYQDAALPALERKLFSEVPLRAPYEETTLAWSLDQLRETLGADDPLVQQLLRGRSPEAMAAQLLSRTRLDNVGERRRLWTGGSTAIASADDPFIQLARVVDPLARELRQQYESQVLGPEARATQSIARLRFAQAGPGGYPEATFSPRLSYGELRGWEEDGKPAAVFTQWLGAFARQTGFAPFLLPDRWNRAKQGLEMRTPLNFVSDHDVVGGNSGSPMINRQGQLVGLVFDGNRYALAGAYRYDGRTQRAVSVHPAAILEALGTIYAAPELKAELQGQ